jgi:hypothetical protein
MKQKETRIMFVLLSLAALLISAYMHNEYVFKPLRLAVAHVPNVYYSIKGLILSVWIAVLGVIGLGAALLASDAQLKTDAPRHPQQPPAKVELTLKRKVLFAAMIAVFSGATFLVFNWFQGEMARYGYQVAFW